MSTEHVLIEKTERFVRKFYINRLIQGVLIGAALWIVFYLLVNTLEYFSWFSSKIRFALFLLLLLGSAIVLVFYFLIPLVNLIRFRKKMSLEQAALLIGKFFPDVQDKLLNTLQLANESNAGSQDELLLATIEQRTQQLSPVRFSDAVDLKGNLRYLYLFLTLLLVLVLLMLFLPKFALQPAQRIINYEQEYEKPLPFTVTLSEEAIESVQGEDVPFSIHVEGSRIPDVFYVKSVLGQQAFTKTSTNDFSYSFKNLFHDVSFQVVGGDYISKPVQITVHPTPALLSYSCHVIYPGYIHRAAEVFEGKTRLMVPQGSRLQFAFFVRDCDSVSVVLDSVAQYLSVADNQATLHLTAASTIGFDLLCQNRWSNRFDPLRFTVDVLPDAYPDIRVESFEEPFSSIVYYSGLVADDYGFTKLVFHCDIKQPVERHVVIPIVFDKTAVRTSFFHHFNMDSLGILPGQSMDVYFEVWDNDGFHGPKSKRSEVFSYFKPSTAALDSVADQTQNNILEKMSDRSDDAAKLKEDIEKMLQELASKKELDWSDKEKMKELLEKQAAIEEDWNKLQEEQEKLNDFMRDHDLANEEFLKKQEKINELFNELIPDELKKLMEEIERLLDEMPRDRMQQLLQDMKKDNQKMQDLLDRNLSLLEQLKMEKELNEFMDQLNKLGEELKDEKESISADEAKKEFDELMNMLDSLQKKNETLSDPFNIQKDESLEEQIEQDLDEASSMEKGEEQNNSSSQQKKNDAGNKMQKMANSMMMQMQSSGDEQLAEDAHLVRILLENVIRASHQQEALMANVGKMRTDDPSLSDKIALQKELSSNFDMVRDSLKAMAMRQPAVQNFIFDEISTIDNQTSLALKYMNDLRLSAAVNNQQTALRSMNNLALMLSESLQEMENSMMGSGNSMRCNKPSSGQQSQNMQHMKQLQEQLGEQLKKMQEQMQQNGQQGLPSSQSEELARMAAEQEMIRQGMQQMLDEMKKNGQIGDDGLNQIIKDMEKLEEDIVNKRITRKTIEQNRQILSRMLESEKAQQKRDQDERRKSNEYKGSRFDRSVEELFYNQQLKKNREFLKKNPIQYNPYYKSKINEYYLKKNQF
jgi:hypothetical protein